MWRRCRGCTSPARKSGSVTKIRSRCASKGSTAPRRIWAARCSGNCRTTTVGCSTRCAAALAPLRRGVDSPPVSGPAGRRINQHLHADAEVRMREAVLREEAASRLRIRDEVPHAVKPAAVEDHQTVALEIERRLAADLYL